MYFPSTGLPLLQPLPCVKLYGESLKFVTSYVYLGIHINDKLNDDDCILAQIRGLYSRANTIKRKFAVCSPTVKKTLFKSHCSQLFASQLWDSASPRVVSKCRIAYNNCFRILMDLPRFCSASEMFVSHVIDTFDAMWRKQCYAFIPRIYNSSNSIIKSVLKSDANFRNNYLRNIWSRLYS